VDNAGSHRINAEHAPLALEGRAVLNSHPLGELGAAPERYPVLPECPWSRETPGACQLEKCALTSYESICPVPG
jgi:hypothetical protein